MAHGSWTMMHLANRSAISVRGPDARGWLDNLITNDMGLLDTQAAIFGGLLSPQGKILFEFFVVRMGGWYLIETQGDQVQALLKRLSMYKLRAQVTLAEVASDVLVGLDADNKVAESYADPRAANFCHRLILGHSEPAAHASAEAYHAARVKRCIPEAPYDYALGDTFPHEANWDLTGGVSFTKGCFIGQEVVSRMQNKTVVRKRVVRVSGAAPLARGAEVRIGEAVIGAVGTVAGLDALAMLRLDRAAEVDGAGLSAGGVVVTVDRSALDAYRTSVANKPVIDL